MEQYCLRDRINVLHDVPGGSAHPLTLPATSGARDHLFVSYAIEDTPFVRWLAAKLALCGFRVWWDQTHLRGGAAFPSEIDDAIKTRSFRVLAVMSHSSSHKPNPERERGVALNVGRQRNEDFLIPLNLDLATSEIPFQVANLTFVPFMANWAEGLTVLLATLRDVGAPCFPDEAATMFRGHLAQPTFVVDEPELVWLNLFSISNVPKDICRYEWDNDVPDEAIGSWVHHREDARACWGFEPPPEVSGNRHPRRDQYSTASYAPSKATPMKHICTSLLRQYIERRCLDRGLIAVANRRHFYFPSLHPNAARLNFQLPDGRDTWLQPVGTRRVWHAGHPEQVRHHLAVMPRVEFSRFGLPMLQLRPTVYFTAEDGSIVDSLRNVRRAKAVRRVWYNDKWLARVAAFGYFLADGVDAWKLHDVVTTTISRTPVGFQSPSRLDEVARSIAIRASIDDGDETEVEHSDLHEVDFDEEDDDD